MQRATGNSGCQPRPNGNMRAGPAARISMAQERTRRKWDSRTSSHTRGIETIQKIKLILSAPEIRMGGDCTTCTATFGNGARIGLIQTSIRKDRSAIQSITRLASSGSFVAEAGFWKPTRCVQRIAAASFLRPRASLLVSDSRGICEREMWRERCSCDYSVIILRASVFGKGGKAR